MYDPEPPANESRLFSDTTSSWLQPSFTRRPSVRGRARPHGGGPGGAGTNKKTRESYWHGPGRVIMTALPGAVWIAYKDNVVKKVRSESDQRPRRSPSLSPDGSAASPKCGGSSSAGQGIYRPHQGRGPRPGRERGSQRGHGSTRTDFPTIAEGEAENWRLPTGKRTRRTTWRSCW